MPSYSHEKIEPKACHRKLNVKGFRKKFNFYLCEARNSCPKDIGIKTTCALDLANTGGCIALKKLASDTIENIGYAIRSVEWRIVWLNSVGYVINIEGKKRRETTDLYHITDHCRIVPLEFETPPKATKPYVQRGSSWSNCPLERLLSSLDENVFPIKIPVRPESLCGTLEHKIQNGRFESKPLIHENLLVKASLADKLITRNKYCELEVEYTYLQDGKDYTVRGHPDAILQIVDKNTNDLEGIGILDFKHARYGSSESPSYKSQMLTYALAVAQMRKLTPKYFLLVSVKSPLEKHPDSWRETEPLMTLIPNTEDNWRIKELHENLVKHEGLQRQMLNDTKEANYNRTGYERKPKNGCLTKGRDYDKPCYKKEVCDFLLEQANSKNTTIKTILKDNDWLPKDLAYH